MYGLTTQCIGKA